MVKIVLDAGHGPNTAGKRSPDGVLREFMFNSVVATLTDRILSQQGYTVSMTHDLNRDVPLYERVQKTSKEKATIFVSIHANAFGNDWNEVAGIETYIFPTASKETLRLATLIQHTLISITNQKNRGIKKADFYVLRATPMPAVLIECGFMTNRKDMALLENHSYRLLCAQAIADGIRAWVEKPTKK